MPYIQNSAFDSLKGVRRKTLAMLFFEQPPWRKVRLEPHAVDGFILNGTQNVCGLWCTKHFLRKFNIAKLKCSAQWTWGLPFTLVVSRRTVCASLSSPAPSSYTNVLTRLVSSLIPKEHAYFTIHVLVCSLYVSESDFTFANVVFRGATMSICNFYTVLVVLGTDGIALYAVCKPRIFTREPSKQCELHIFAALLFGMKRLCNNFTKQRLNEWQVGMSRGSVKGLSSLISATFPCPSPSTSIIACLYLHYQWKQQVCPET